MTEQEIKDKVDQFAIDLIVLLRQFRLSEDFTESEEEAVKEIALIIGEKFVRPWSDRSRE